MRKSCIWKSHRHLKNQKYKVLKAKKKLQKTSLLRRKIFLTFMPMNGQNLQTPKTYPNGSLSQRKTPPR